MLLARSNYGKAELYSNKESSTKDERLRLIRQDRVHQVEERIFAISWSSLSGLAKLLKVLQARHDAADDVVVFSASGIKAVSGYTTEHLFLLFNLNSSYYKFSVKN
jgi:hypothetical protein